MIEATPCPREDDECGGKGPWVRGMCHKHYRRAQRAGILPSPLTRYVEDDSGCWSWAGPRDYNGYGRQGPRFAHRMFYEQHYGAIPAGFELDHLCRNRTCVNPDHLEVVTHSENLRRSVNSYGSRVLCRSGRHDITDPANIYTRPDGDRQCRPCRLENSRRNRMKTVAF